MQVMNLYELSVLNSWMPCGKRISGAKGIHQVMQKSENASEKTQPLRLVDLCMTPCGGTYVYPRLPGSWTRLDSKQELGVPNDFLANIQLEVLFVKKKKEKRTKSF